MCRVLTYLGHPILLEELLYQPDNSFVKQSYSPLYMFHILNLAGFGLATWIENSYQPQRPFIYKTLQLPFYDRNLVNLSSKLKPHCILAHLRGVDFSHRQTVSLENVHPFIFEGTNIAFAHNGDLYGFKEMKFDLLKYILPDFRKMIRGSTDSEWIYALFMSLLLKSKKKVNQHSIFSTLNDVITILKKVRKKNHINVHSPMNLFITNGEFIAAIRYVLDFGNKPDFNENIDVSVYHSLWYRLKDLSKTKQIKNKNNKSSIIISSEPLTSDTNGWVQLPEYSYIYAQIKKNGITLTSNIID